MICLLVLTFCRSAESSVFDGNSDFVSYEHSFVDTSSAESSIDDVARSESSVVSEIFLPSSVSKPLVQSKTSEISSVSSPEPIKSTESTLPTVINIPSIKKLKNVKAMWLSQYDLKDVYSKNGAQRSEAEFRSLMKRIFENVALNGFNTVFIQVRPFADSFYPSEYYPPSSFVTGKYGNDFEYDPFKIIISLAHENNLSVHAWINPLRGMYESEIAFVDGKYAVKRWFSDETKNGKYIVKCGSRYYFNPAYDEVRKLIVDGAAEITKKYDVDGLHMDDYFYPTTDESFDKSAFDNYVAGGGNETLADFRRDSLNKLVSGFYSAVKSVSKDLLFGVSPGGNINTAFSYLYADVYTWGSVPGYVDYLCPQVYFGLEHETYDFAKVCNVWQDVVKADGIDLMIGMTLGKALAGSDLNAGTGKYEWTENKDVLARCLSYTKNLKNCRGVSIFCYQYFYDPVIGTSVAETEAERNNFIPLLKSFIWN